MAVSLQLENKIGEHCDSFSALELTNLYNHSLANWQKKTAPPRGRITQLPMPN